MKLKDCCNFQEGYVNPSQSNSEYFDGPIKWLRASDLNDGNVYLTERTLSERGFQSAGKSALLFKKNTLAISKSGTIGKLGILQDIMCGNRAVINIEVLNDLANLHYVFYTLKYKRKEILRKAEGSIQKNLYVSALETISLNHSGKTIQNAIASVLYSLDSKIELNNKINAELEAMAKTIYDYWFVQFDFPDAKGKPYKSSGGTMVWNEELKREIPEGWEIEILNNVVSTILDHRGKTPLKLGGDWVNKGEGVIAISAKHVKDGKLVKLEEANIVGYEMYEKWMSEKLKEGDIIMTSEAPLGEFYFILNDTNYCMSQRIFAIRADGIKVLPTYLYYELSKGNGYSQIIGKASGSTVFGIRQDELRKVNVLKPKLELQKTFDEKVKPMLYQIRNNEFQNQQLASLRDWLLPMLMNGQVKVK